MVDVAHEEGAGAVGHGSTGKGNDQVRFDVSMQALAPDLRIVAPVREWDMKTREDEMAYAAKHNIPIPVTKESPYSTDENLWGRSIECGVLEDPWQEPPEDIYEWTRSVKDAPEKPSYVEIGFERGMPVSLDGEEIDGVTLVRAPERPRRRARHRPGRPRRGPPGRHQVARDLRGAGRRHPPGGARGAGAPDARQAADPDEGAHRPGVRRPHL